jgi:hypothetical protein
MTVTIPHHATHGFDDDIDADTNEQKAIGEGSKDLDTSQTKRIARIVLAPCLGGKAQTEEGNEQRCKVDQYVPRIRKQREATREKAPDNLRDEDHRRKCYGNAKGTDVRVLMDVTMVVIMTMMMPVVRMPVVMMFCH